MDASAAKSKGCDIQNGGGEDVRLLGAEQLAAEGERPEKIRVSGRRVIFPILNQVICREGIFRGDVVVRAQQTKIFANLLERIGESFGQTAAQLRSVRRRPEVVRIWQHARLQLRH